MTQGITPLNFCTLEAGPASAEEIDKAEFFLKLSPLLEAPEEVAKRLDRDPGETAELMERMAKKGVIFRQRKGKTARYGAVPYVPGIYDFQLGTMGRGFAQDMQDYFEEGFGRAADEKGRKRTIPATKI